MYNNPDTKDKVLCAVLYTGIFLPYITLAPIIWIVFANIKKIHLKEFVKYHCFQAVLFNMIIFFLPGFFDLVISFLGNLFGIVIVAANSINFPEPINSLILSTEGFSTALLQFKNFVLGIYMIFAHVLTFYAVIWTARGKYTYIPPISQAVNQILR